MYKHKNKMAKLLGVTDDNLGCACCGRSDLKRYAVIQDDNGEIATYGSDCATKVLGRKVSTRSLTKIKLDPNIIPVEVVEVKDCKLTRSYNYILREYELAVERPNNVSLNLLLHNFKDSYEYMLDVIEEEVNPIVEMAMAIDWLEQLLNPKQYAENQKLFAALKA